MQFVSDMQFSKFYCDRYDNGLTKNWSVLRIFVAWDQLQRVSGHNGAKRVSKRFMVLIFFGIGTLNPLFQEQYNSCAFQHAVPRQYIARLFCKPTAATMIYKLLYNNQILDNLSRVWMVCSALELDESVCNPEDANFCEDSLTAVRWEGASSGVPNGFWFSGMQQMGKFSEEQRQLELWLVLQQQLERRLVSLR